MSISDDLPNEPDAPHYLALKASAAACFRARDFLGAKAIYTELLYDPAYRNAAVYCNRSLVNFKLDLSLSSYHDAMRAVILSDQRWRKPVCRIAEAAALLSMHEVAVSCFTAAGLEDKAAAVLRQQSEQRSAMPQHMVDYAEFSYVLRPQLPPRDAQAIAQAIDEINSRYAKIAVRDVPGMGRGIFATCDIEQGDAILIEKPFVAAIVDGDRCQQCFCELTPTVRHPNPPAAVTCNGCGVERYCSNRCRDEAWELYHRVQCAHATALKEARDFAATSSTPSAILPFLVARLAGMTMCNASWPCHTLSLPHMQLFSPGSNQGKMNASDVCFARQIVTEALGLDHEPRFDIEWYEAVFAVAQNNNFVIAREGAHDPDREGSKMGIGLYMTASLFNHSCAPNASWQAGCLDDNDCDFPFNSITVHATQPIKCGEQIYISYIPSDKPYKQRQSTLHGGYGFDCRCPRCEQEKPCPLQNIARLVDNFNAKSFLKVIKLIPSLPCICTQLVRMFTLQITNIPPSQTSISKQQQHENGDQKRTPPLAAKALKTSKS